ncbi:MAG: rhamnulokinase family protein [Chthoniobacteraceae bacterium]
MADQLYIACDLGAESGRVMLGTLSNGKLTLEEIHRFPNGPTRVLGTLRWNLLRIFDELKTGLRKLAARGIKAESLSVDSWGVDYAYLGKTQPMLGLPFNYRDERTDRTYQPTLDRATPELIFEETGIQFMSINTIYQLVSDLETQPELLQIAERFLHVGDYFNYLFSGVAKVDASNASTSQIYNPRTKTWSKALIEKLGLPAHIFPEVVPAGTTLGSLLPAVAAETGLPVETKVVATCSHDTGAAVAAVPASGDDWAYLSSGTWSLIGVELPGPLINEAAAKANFTNEVGYNDTSRFLKNIAGLWLLQECRRTWLKEGRDYSYAELNQLAQEAEPLRSLVNPNHAPFAKPDDMPAKIRAYCEATGQPAPETPGQFVRCILESLALLYSQYIGELESITGRTIRKLHIVGGGSQSKMLNQFTADAIGLPVLAGPVEATAIGNILVQALGLGQLDSLEAARKIVHDSFAVETFTPDTESALAKSRERFAVLFLRTV